MNRTAIIAACLIVLAGCGSGRRIRQESLERLDWTGGTPENRYVRDRLAAALEASSAADLRRPQLVDIVFYGRSPEAEEAQIVFNWIASPPTADGAILKMKDGSTISVDFPRAYVEENERESQHHAICQAAVARASEPGTWDRIDADAVISGQLTENGRPVSNVCPFRRRAAGTPDAGSTVESGRPAGP